MKSFPFKTMPAGLTKQTFHVLPINIAYSIFYSVFISQYIRQRTCMHNSMISQCLMALWDPHHCVLPTYIDSNLKRFSILFNHCNLFSFRICWPWLCEAPILTKIVTSCLSMCLYIYIVLVFCFFFFFQGLFLAPAWIMHSPHLFLIPVLVSQAHLSPPRGHCRDIFLWGVAKYQRNNVAPCRQSTLGWIDLKALSCEHVLFQSCQNPSGSSQMKSRL